MKLTIFLSVFLWRTLTEEIAEVVVELVGNAGEHSDSDCLVDLDVTKKYHKVGKR